MLIFLFCMNSFVFSIQIMAIELLIVHVVVTLQANRLLDNRSKLHISRVCRIVHNCHLIKYVNYSDVCITICISECSWHSTGYCVINDVVCITLCKPVPVSSHSCKNNKFCCVFTGCFCVLLLARAVCSLSNVQ